MIKKQTIFDGAYLFDNALSIDKCQIFLDEYKKFESTFYTPVLKFGHQMNLKMNCLGQHWNAKDYSYYNTRTDIDNDRVWAIPNILIDIIKPYSGVCFPYHSRSWDICIINEYDIKSTLGLHADNSESEAALKIGHPIISVSFGLSAIFKVGGFSREDEYKEILLRHGDVLVMGGPSRLRYHGISKIIPDSNSEFQKRVNFTFRKF